MANPILVPQLLQFFVKSRVLTNSGHVVVSANTYTYQTIRAVDYVVGSKPAWSLSFRTQILPTVAAASPQLPTPIEVWCWAVNIPGDTFTLQINGPIGAVIGPWLPVRQCVYIGLRCPVRGRNFLGSKRYSPISISHVTGDELNASGYAAWSAVGSVLTSLVTATGLSGTDLLIPGVWSRKYGSPSPPPAQQWVGFVFTPLLDRNICVWKHRRERTVR